jgi:hypothetical protein
MTHGPTDFYFHDHSGRTSLIVLDPEPTGLAPRVFPASHTDGKYSAGFALDNAWSRVIEDRICDALDGLAEA